MLGAVYGRVREAAVLSAEEGLAWAVHSLMFLLLTLAASTLGVLIGAIRWRRVGRTERALVVVMGCAAASAVAWFLYRHDSLQ
jgi:hypothetical protein